MDMDDQARLYEERQSILQAQAQADAMQVGSAALFRAQVDTFIHTLQVDEWGAYQEYHQEQLQNALEYELMRQRDAGAR